MMEMVIIAGIALVVIGPEKFPPFAKAVMRTFREIRTQFEEAQREITKELQPVRKELNELKKHKPEEYLEKLAASDSGGSDFDYEYPYREHENTTKKSETNKPDPDVQPFDYRGAGAQTTDAASPESDINPEPEGPDWERYDAERAAAKQSSNDPPD